LIASETVEMKKTPLSIEQRGLMAVVSLPRSLTQIAELRSEMGVVAYGQRNSTQYASFGPQRK
jgi:hypothetical protein